MSSQAPKNLPPAAKQQKVLTWFQESMGVYTLKELEKLLPGVASINGMQVKEYLQALQDDNLIRVEKIGSGNWYWSFKSDAKKQKERTLNTLNADESKLVASIADAERQLDEELAKRAEDNEMLDGDSMDRNTLLKAHETYLKESEILDRQMALYNETNPAELTRKVEETRRLKEAAHEWTGRIESLECFLASVLNDRNELANIMA